MFVFIFVIIVIDRYNVVMCFFKVGIKMKVVIFVFVNIWLFGIIFSFLNLFFFEVIDIFDI